MIVWLTYLWNLQGEEIKPPQCLANIKGCVGQWLATYQNLNNYKSGNEKAFFIGFARIVWGNIKFAHTNIPK